MPNTPARPELPEADFMHVERDGWKRGTVLNTNYWNADTVRQLLADERRKALEEAAKVPRAYAEQLDRGGWGNRFPDELTAIFNASTNMADNILRLIDKEPTT